MSRATHSLTGPQIRARLWRSFVTAAYLFAVVAWTATDARPAPMPLTMCVYGRCPTVVAAVRGGVHPTALNVALLGVAALLVAWAVPALVEDLNKLGDQPCAPSE